jgi:hypothetical protein
MSTGPDPADPLARRRARRLVDEGTILDPVMDPEERARIGLSGDPDDPVPVLIENTQLSHWQQQALDTDMLGQLRGMAPLCKLVSLKVLDDLGSGMTSGIVRALRYVNDGNTGYGPRR